MMSLAVAMVLERFGAPVRVCGETPLRPHHIVHRQLDVIGSWVFTGAHLADYVRMLPALLDRFDLASLVTAYPLLDAERALRAVAEGSVLKAVLTAGG